MLKGCEDADEPSESEPAPPGPKAKESELYEGKLGLKITPPANTTQLKELERWLRMNPNINVELVDETTSDGASLTIDVMKPTPIMDVLTWIPNVAQAERENGTIYLMLKNK